MSNINDLLESKKPLHPVELKQCELSFFTTYAYIWYKDDKNLYAFKENKMKPFLDFYAKFDYKE